MIGPQSGHCGHIADNYDEATERTMGLQSGQFYGGATAERTTR